MADVTDTSNDGGNVVQMFECRQCAGNKLYTPAEKALHRQWHNRQNTTQNRARKSLNEPSEVTTILEQAQVAPGSSKVVATERKRVKIYGMDFYRMQMQQMNDYNKGQAGGCYMPPKKRDRIPLPNKQRKIRSKKVFDQSHMSDISSSTSIGG